VKNFEVEDQEDFSGRLIVSDLGERQDQTGRLVQVLEQCSDVVVKE
jgi:hypothetical protein